LTLEFKTTSPLRDQHKGMQTKEGNKKNIFHSNYINEPVGETVK
jgi:hypothetical protein